uniref:auxilin-like protein 1 isoform X2 n=1 Tax=Fragaria vesca subsp. vesca TaxID=101020 RepID=UPI0005CB6F44|nr:PREDICTED: auxilin-like protein 1 isoform X2 [Fragaria vesca subsp. vesca]
MDYRTSSAVALSQKLSTGHSIYDGVFSSAPAKFTVSSFSSTLDDYREIFGGGGASSIPVLEVPELNERKVDVRSSQLDYSNVFGGFGDSDFAVPYEKLFDEPKMQKETRRQSERVSPPKEAKRSCSEEGIDLANEAAYESIDGVKKFSMSYNQSNHRSKSFSGVHSVPAYTCLVDETSPLRATEGDKPVSMSSVAKERRMEGNRSAKAMRDQPAGDAGKQASGGGGGVKAENDSNWKNSIDELFKTNKSGLGTHPSSVPPFTSQVLEVDKPVSLVANDASIVNGQERKMGGNHHIKTTGDQQATDASKQTSGGVARVQNSSKWRSSGSVDKLFYSGELAQESRPSNMPPFSSMRSDGKGEFEKPMASVFGVLNRDTFEGADNVSSSPYFDEEVDTNSVAAASVAALTKAIEEAQASIQMAKELMDRKKVGPQSRVKLSFDNSMKPKSRKGSKFADKASISKETKTREPYNKVDVPVHVSAGLQQVTPVFENASTISDVTVTGEEVRGKEFADNTCIFTKKTDELQEEVHVSGKEFADNACIFTKKTDELQEEVHVSGKEFADNACIFTKKTDELQEEVHVSAQPEQVTVILADTDKHYGVMEARGKVHGHEFEPTPTDHRHEEADDLEAADQFYEFADTSEQDVSEASEQFYEFADSSEPDVSEATEEFYEFADSNEHHDIVLENEKANNPRQMFQSVDYEEQEKKTDMEAFENPEQVGKISKAVTAEEQRGVENLLSVVEEVSEFEEIDELASSQECSNQEDNEKPEEAPREHEETGKLKTTHVKETCEEKQNGDEKRFETQELQEIEHVKINLVTQEWDENEKIDKDGCVLEENEREQPYAQSEEDSDSTLNEHKKEEIIESVNGFYDKEDFEKRLEDDRISEGNEKLQDTRPNEKILEEAACQKECENHQEESFEFIEAGRMQIEMDESTRNEKVQATQEERENLDCIIEAADNLNEQDVCEALDSKQGSARDVDCDQDVKETLKLPINKEDGGVKEVAGTSIQLEENKGVKEVAGTSIQLEENEHQTELVEEENGMVEKEICQTDGLTPGVQLPERPKQMEDATEIHSLDKNGISASESDMSFVQTQDDQLLGEPSVDYNVGRQVEECEEWGDNSDMMRAEVVLNQERNKNGSKSRKRWFGTNEVSEPFIKLEGDGNQSESVEEEDVMEEKVICEIEGLASGVKFAEILKQMEDVVEIHSSDTNGTSVYGQKQDGQLAREPEVVCNLQKHVEEFGDINKDMMGPEVAAVNQAESMNITKSSHRKRWFDNGKDTKVAQAPHIFCRKAGSVLLDNDTDTSLSTKRDKENHHKVMTSQSTEVNEDSQQATLSPKESETIHSSLKEFEQENNANPQTTLSAEESETDHNSLEVEPQSQAIPRAKETETNFIFQKEVEREKENQQESQTANEFEISASSQKVVELEKEHLIQKAEKRRERERQKEKKKVAQVFRETRERSFADVKEKVAETRQKEMAEAQGKLGKTSVQANDTSLAEKASKEAKAKQKWERAAVERITAEARDRALEKALSEKVAAEAGKQVKRSVPEKYSGASTDGKQAKRSVSEKFAGASRDNGLSRSLDLESKGSFSSSTSRSSNSSNLSAEQSTGTNGESAQRFKATLERNQRTAERAAKALAEKNNRDLLVQQEQAERNRLAEVLDAEVKRWSSGKERNLRALLSTLQYILGPDSGWQPVPLTDIVTAVAVKKAYRKAALFVHPDKLQQRGASIQQKYTCEKVFDLLKDAWNRFSMDER